MGTTDRRRELLGFGLLSLALFFALSLLPVRALGATGWFPTGNVMGPLGAAFARAGYALVGGGLPLLVMLPALAGATLFGWLERPRAARLMVLVSGSAILLPAFLAVAFTRGWTDADLAASPAGAGWLGSAVAMPLAALLGWLGASLLLLVLFAALSIATIGWNPARTAGAAGLGMLGRLRRGRRTGETPGLDVIGAAPATGLEPELEAGVEDDDDFAPEPAAATSASPAKKSRKKTTARESVLEEFGRPHSGELAPITLLSNAPPKDHELSEKELDRLGAILIETLRTFKVEGAIGGRTTGPVVTQFEVVPAPGVKVNRIAALDADLALALKAPSVRIVAPIPGKGAVGVEVPNPEPEVVSLREILAAPAFQQNRGLLPLALGKDLGGDAYVADLSRMPHLLIAGATGSGKSVCINTVVTSLIYRHSPQTLRLLMIDPKMVELSMYGDLPHLRHPVITDPSDAAMVLKWAVLETERRYELLSKNNARSLSEFNKRLEQGRPLKTVEPHGFEDDPDRWVYDEGPLPFVVLIIDELADLMLSVQAEIERPLAQLAQKARAIGIHLIVATQRPSVNVITGLIKANFPSRIAFRVSSKVDSRTILDQNGADALLGNGDMLFLPPGRSDPVRIQGAFLSTEDTERLMDWYRQQAGTKPEGEEIDILELVRSHEEDLAGERVDAVLEERDALFRQAAEICVQHQQGSTSLLQRRLKIGYGRAARIVDQLHHAGVLGPPEGSRPRDVLVSMDQLDRICAIDDGSSDAFEG
ncbi:MAG TPA: DNA translocase FtsK [Longimicrobiales bacterium]|nr:DNA translocase FtsK [Longimicrobiales bacterium]